LRVSFEMAVEDDKDEEMARKELGCAKTSYVLQLQ
jgi:hypothetical protein